MNRVNTHRVNIKNKVLAYTIVLWHNNHSKVDQNHIFTKNEPRRGPALRGSLWVRCPLPAPVEPLAHIMQAAEYSVLIIVMINSDITEGIDVQ